jgi:hypothetical protein
MRGGYMTAPILEQTSGGLKFSDDVEEYILDSKMQLKAVKLKDGRTIDHERLHSHFSPKHPLISTPSGLRSMLDQFFVHEFRQRRIPVSG